MRQVLIIVFLGTLLFSCKKDKVPVPCSGIEMIGERSKMVGTWRWYKTWVNQTFASGNTYTFDYTPDSEGFNYYCVISEDGWYKGYRDSVLVHEYLMSSVRFENFKDSNRNDLSAYLDCSMNRIGLGFNEASTNDTVIDVWEYPLRIDDEVTKKHSTLNFFKKQ